MGLAQLRVEGAETRNVSGTLSGNFGEMSAKLRRENEKKKATMRERETSRDRDVRIPFGTAVPVKNRSNGKDLHEGVRDRERGTQREIER